MRECIINHNRMQVMEVAFVATLYGSLMRQKQSPEVFCTKTILRNFAKFTGKRLCQSLFFKITSLDDCF